MSLASKKPQLPEVPLDTLSAEVLSKKLPRGANSLPKEDALRAQAIRIIHAIARCVASKGYAATTVADITAEAGVSRTTFYELFKDKEACFLAGFRSSSRDHLKLVRHAYSVDGHLADRGTNAIRTYVNFVDSDRTFAIAFIAEAASASPAIREALAGVEQSFAKLLKNWLKQVQSVYPEVQDCSALTFQLLISALSAFIEERARRGAKSSGEGVSDLVVFTMGTMGLYGWARKARDASPNWGAPLR